MPTSKFSIISWVNKANVPLSSLVVSLWYVLINAFLQLCQCKQTINHYFTASISKLSRLRANSDYISFLKKTPTPPFTFLHWLEMSKSISTNTLMDLLQSHCIICACVFRFVRTYLFMTQKIECFTRVLFCWYVFFHSRYIITYL